MSLQFSTTLRNAFLDQIEVITDTAAKLMIYTGSVPANCAAAEAGTLLAQFDLASDWASAAATGAKALTSVPLSTTAGASGTAAHFRLHKTDGTTCTMQGTVTTTGGGGDMTVDNTNIASSQTVQITSFTITAPGV